MNDDIVLGFANGYSDIQAQDLGYSVFRGRDVHLLGSSPVKQYDAIEKLTQPNLNGDPPANVVGVDWNGPHKVAYKGEYWSRNGWQTADHLSIRETVRESLKEVKAFWQDQDLWMDTTPLEIEGLPVEHPDDPVYTVSGSDIETREDLEKSHVINRDGRTLAFESNTAKKFFEYREGYL